jgi:enterochelin esterase-like enzyme
MNLVKLFVFLFFVIALLHSRTTAQGVVVSEAINAASLEGNLIGDPSSRSVAVYLPPDYEKKKKIRYPVVYLLHGFGSKGGGDKVWVARKWFSVEAVNRLIREGKIDPMIIVMPDGGNKFGGSYYTNSITTGNWEDFIVVELVAFIDKRYRTLARSDSRGIAGHSMGGYGAIKLAMKYPNIFGAAYGTSACCLNTFPSRGSTSEDAASSTVWPTMKVLEEAAAVKTWEEGDRSSLFVRFTRAYAAAFSPNPTKPPFFADYPLVKDGESTALVDHAQARWLANIPMWMIDQYRPNLLKLRGLAFDAGSKEDPAILQASRDFSTVLKRSRVDHTYSEFDGGHMDKLDERIEARILPFFSRSLMALNRAG